MRTIDTDPVDDICNRGVVKDSDVTRLRRMVYGGEGIAVADVEMLFRINRTARMQDPAWSKFFIEAVSDYIINEQQPQGYVTAENASWLIARISTDERIASATEFELLVNVLDQARWVPESLVRFALDQVLAAVRDGTGPLRHGRAASAPHSVTADDVAVLRRILYAFGGDGNAAITRSEAEVLFDLEEITADHAQASEWQELFVKAIASLVMSTSGYKVPSREEALRREAWLQQRGELSLGGIFGRLLSIYQAQSQQEKALARLERQRIEIITHEAVSEGDAAWLATRIARDGKTTANERLLLAFIKQERPNLDPALQQLIDAGSKVA